MLALQARSFQNYFFIEARNANHPPRYAGNNLAGILSENKVQHASKSNFSFAFLISQFILPLTHPQHTSETFLS